MPPEQLVALIQGKEPPENLAELRFRFREQTARNLGVREGIDATELSQAGWGVIFAQDADPAIREALGDLLALRREQAGDYFRCYEGADGYLPEESKSKFLARHGAGPGPADPSRVPYYLLIAGSPELIPYRFQSQLDVQYAVGRIHFESVQEYSNYARSVVAAETGQFRRPRRAAVFGVANAGDRPTQLSVQHLVEPVAHKVQGRVSGWQFESYLKEQATKAQIARLLDAARTSFLTRAPCSVRTGLARGNGSRPSPRISTSRAMTWKAQPI
jgi:hypothetical protein